MSDITDATGTAIESRATARALEPARGEQGAGHPAQCLNCEAELIGAYCHHCGQTSHIHKTIGAFFHDILHGALHFEGKIFHTLPLLAWNPGALTRRYIDGHRARFVSPMALFLFSVFLLFATLQIAGIAPPADPVPAGSEQIENGLDIARSDAETRLAALREQAAALPEGDAQRQVLASDIADVEASLEAMSLIPKIEPGTNHKWLDSLHSDWERLDKGLQKAKQNPGLMLYKLQTNSYKFSWLLIPLSLPFVALLFLWRRKFGLYDHAVFVTYSIAFMTLLLIAVTILTSLGLGSSYIGPLATAVPVWHIYRQLRGTYGLTRFSAVWRTVVLLFFISLVLVLFVFCLMMLGFLG